jgi:alkylation response protein AidB-like acyl-CoA dehydrogenase
MSRSDEEVRHTVTATETLSREELLERADALVPILAERAQETEELRRIPQATLDDIVASRLLRTANPTRYGGHGLDWDSVWEIGWRLGQGCGSTAWCFMVAAIHNWHVGLASEAAQEEYFGDGPDVFSCSAFNPGGARLEVVEGGYTLAGRWSFSSGCDHASWALLAALVPDPRGAVLFLVPRSDWRIEDDWHASGMRGTGSKTIVVDEPVFVPEHRWLPIYGGDGARARALHGRASYGVPIGSLLPYTLACPLVGVAQGAVNAFEERMRTRLTTVGRKPMAELVAVQSRLAEAAALVDAARELARSDLREMIDRAAGGEEPTMLERARYRRNHAFVARLSVQAVDVLFAASGGSAIYDREPMQRFHRDVHAGSHHVILGWDENAEQYGRVRLGLEFQGAMI